MLKASQKTTSRWTDHLDSWVEKFHDNDLNNYDFGFHVYPQGKSTENFENVMVHVFSFQTEDGRMIQVRISLVSNHVLEFEERN